MKTIISFIGITLSFLSIVIGQNKYISNEFFGSNFIQVKDGNLTSCPVSKDWNSAEWKIITTSTSNIIQIVNVVSGMALDVENNKLVLKPQNSSLKTQLCLMEQNKGASTYTFKNTDNNYYLINWGKPDDMGICQYLLLSKCSWFITDVKERIEIKKGIVIKPECGRSQSTINYLKTNNIEYVEYSISDKVNQTQMYEQLRNNSNFKNGSITLPVIIKDDKIDYNIKNLDKYLTTLK